MCLSLTSWRRLCNALGALARQGYHDETELLTTLAASLESIQGPWRDLDSPLIRKGKPFERLVARLYLEELAPFIRSVAPSQHLRRQDESVRVLWNQKLPRKKGATKQVDVVLEWVRDGQRSLTLVECKDHEVEVEEMDAFVTALRHVGAEHGVLVSSVGFQSGALICAEVEGIDLRVVTEEDFSTDTVERVVDLYAFEPVQLHLEPREGGPPVLIQIPPHRIEVMRNGIIVGTLSDLVRGFADTEPPVPGTMPPRIDAETPGLSVIFPRGRRIDIAALHITLRIIERRRRCALLLPRHPLSFSIAHPVQLSTSRVDAAVLPVFPTPSLEAGRFYVNLAGQAYYCEDVDASTPASAHIVLLADRQHGHVIDADLVVGLDQAGHYFPVEDCKALRDLQVDLERYRRISAGRQPPAS